jgi:hypothetical protein
VGAELGGVGFALDRLMLPPEQDLADRRPIWDALQVFWMDTDPELDLASVAQVCARSKYSLEEIEQIFWNEIRPAVQTNLSSVAGEWAGFDIEWLSRRILEKHRFGKRLPIESLHGDSNRWWTRLRAEIRRARPSDPLRDESV